MRLQRQTQIFCCLAVLWPLILVDKNQAQGPNLVIKNCTVVSVSDGKLIRNQWIQIENGLISYVGSQPDIVFSNSTHIVDGTGKFILPGLVDMHVHIGHESELTSYLLHGVTTVCNLSGDYVDLFSDERIDICKLRSKVASGQVIGPRIFSAGQALDGDPRTGPFQRALTGPVPAAEAVLEQKRAGFDFIKVYDSLDEPTLNAIIRTAADCDLAVIGHIPEKLSVPRTISSGIQLIAHAEEFYSVFEETQDIERTARELAAVVKKSGVSVTPNTAFIRRMIEQLENLDAVLADEQVKFLAPRVRRWWTPRYNYYTNRENPEKFLAEAKRKYQWLIPLVKELHQADVPLITGTDSSIPGALPGSSMFEEFKDLEAAGLKPLEIVQTATLRPARFLKEHTPHKASGRVRENFAADLLLLDRNPLEHFKELDTILIGVIFNGRYVTTRELRKLLVEQTKEF